MNHPQKNRLLKHLRKFAFSTFTISLMSTGLGLSTSIAEPLGKSDIPQEREIENAFSDNKDRGTIIEATNPMELINRLRQATALDDATQPSDAIDDALKALETKDL